MAAPGGSGAPWGPGKAGSHRRRTKALHGHLPQGIQRFHKNWRLQKLGGHETASWAASEGPSKEASAEIWAIWEGLNFQNLPKFSKNKSRHIQTIQKSQVLGPCLDKFHPFLGVWSPRPKAGGDDPGVRWTMTQEASNNCGWFAMCISMCAMYLKFTLTHKIIQNIHIDIMYNIYIYTSLSTKSEPTNNSC